MDLNACTRLFKLLWPLFAMIKLATCGKMNDFESTASFLLPHDPVANRRTNDRKRNADMKLLPMHVSSQEATTAKPRTGKTGVKLRIHTRSEYSALSDDQLKELSDHRDSCEAKGLHRNLPKKGGKGKFLDKTFNAQLKPGHKKMKVMIAEAVATAIQTKSDKVATNASVDQDFQDYIVSLVEKASAMKKKVAFGSVSAQASSTTVNPPPTPPAVTLNSILGCLKK